MSAALLGGCSPKRAEAPATGTYGPLAGEPSVGVLRTQADPSATQPWTNGELAVLQTELSPATLYHSPSKTLSFFTHLPETGIGGPAFAAISTQQGPKIFKPGERIEPNRMRESWFVVWFAGATNWTNWDSPQFLTLQHRPSKIRFDADGLHFTFTNDAGYAALLPMYGEYKPAQLDQQPLPFYESVEKKKRGLTWEWFRALPADPLARARYWESALREFPIACEESFSVDRAHDSVTLRAKIRWLSWDDDWGTKHLKLAPVSPVLAHAFKESFPAEFSTKPFDMEILTSFGPYYGVEGVDSYDVTLPVLNYIHETAGAGATATGWSNAPCFDAWRAAHAAGSWDAVRDGWPALRDGFRARAPARWAAFAGTDVPPLEQTADALGAARLAYRLGDADTYALACARFARALTQLCAQQRGVNYFRTRQPWRSMEPLHADAALASVSLSGWQVNDTKAAHALEKFPDLARLGRDAQPKAQSASPVATPEKLERLIPSHPPTAFLPGEQTPTFGAGTGLVGQLHAAAFNSLTRQSELSWPHIVLSDWPTPAGAPWNFGQAAPSTNAPARVEVIPLNSNTRVVVYPGR